MPLVKNVGKFKVVAWDEGAPVTFEVSYDGEQVCRVHGVEEVTDLQYALERLQAQLEAKRQAHAFGGR